MDKRYLIEHILTLMNYLQANNLTMEQLIELDGKGGLPSGSSDLLKACEMVLFMDEMPGGLLIYFASEGEEIVYANKAVLRIFQCKTMEEFRTWTGNSFRNLVYPDDLDAVEESIREQISNSQHDLDYVEYRIVRKDGQIRWIEDYGHFIRCGGAGDIFYVFLNDATEKHNRILGTISDAKRHEEKMRGLLESSDKERILINQKYLRQLEVIQGLSINYVSIFYVDLDEGLVVPFRDSVRTEGLFTENRLSDAASSATAYVDTWVCREDRQMVLDAITPGHIRKRLETCDTYYFNYRALNDGKTEYLQLRIVKVGGCANRVVMGCQRVDEEIRREMEQRQLLSEALENANLAIVAKDTFLSNMSHDMRTPLNGILGHLTLAKLNINDPDALQEYLDGAMASGQQMKSLIDEVLQIAWSDSNEAKTTETKCDLQDILQEVYEFLLPQAKEKDIALTLDSTSLVHSAVYGKPHKLKQMAIYLTGNAVTYTNPGGQVSVTISEQPGLSSQYAVYKLEVADTGIGMSEDFLAHIYEPFMRERNTTCSGVHGSGLGLTIVKKIVDRMGGTIHVKSAPGKGSTFTVSFRLRLQEKPRTAANKSHKAVNLAGKSILLVDDNEINLKIETKIFETLGFRIDTAADGREALEKMELAMPGTYDLILMDLQMPFMDGWEASKAIRALDDPQLASIPIIALSANAFQSDIRKSMESGMDAHLTKPIDVPALVSKVSEVLQSRQTPDR